MIDPTQVRTPIVLGLGRFGGGVGVVRFLAEVAPDAIVTVVDDAPLERLTDSVSRINDLVQTGRVRLRLVPDQGPDLRGADLLVMNPAVPRPWTDARALAAVEQGIPVTTEVALLAHCLPSRPRVVGITGTVGKSTTSAMIHHALTRLLHVPVHLGGNIGGSLLGTAIGPHDVVVLELSSAMLFWLGEGVGHNPRWSPGTAVVTNVAPNHVDWHGSVEHYEQSKHRILENQDPGDLAVLGEAVAGWARGAPAGRILHAAHLPPFEAPLAIPGAHNRVNARLAAAVAAAVADRPVEVAQRALSDFPGLPHRLQFVLEDQRGRRFYNDSKSTTPDATRLAVESFEEPGRVHLIAGGYDKGVDLSSVARLAERLGGFYTIGAVGSALAEAARSHAPTRVESCDTLDAAVERALERMNDGDALLLSPACASWDQFDHFEKRGERFVELVRTACAS